MLHTATSSFILGEKKDTEVASLYCAVLQWHTQEQDKTETTMPGKPDQCC